MTNHEIAQFLRHVAAAYSIIDNKKHYFQIIAYQKASDLIQNSTVQIQDLVNANTVSSLEGIGETMKEHLTQLCTSGHVSLLESVLTKVPQAVFPLLDIPSFGPKKAYKLVTAFSLKDPKTVIQDVLKLASAGKIAPLAGFGEKSQEDIIRAISEFRKGTGKTTRMLLPFADTLAKQLVTYLKECPEIEEVEPLGSLRRKMPTVGDIDIAVATNNPEKAITHFVSYPYKLRIIEQGPTSASLLTSGGQQIDLMTQPTKSFGSLLQHFTGSKHHNIHLREIAQKKGLSLSEKGIKHKSGKITTYASEKEFYHALNMDWVAPEMREDAGEIEMAINHTLPTLIELQDMKGDLHVHSSFAIEPSHDLGNNTMQEHINKAKTLHYEYIGFSEHNPSLSKHSKNEIYSLLTRRKEFIEQLKSDNKNVRIINLLEVDILPTGELAIDDKCFDYLDAAIVSIHSRFNMDSNEMTQRVLTGLSHPKAKILSHPTGRLLQERPGYTLQWDKIFTFCKENNKALEINAWPNRTDLPHELIREAKKYGVSFVIDTDSHSVEHMDLMQYGVWNARKGFSQKNDILNTLGYNRFIQWLSL